MIDLDAIFQLDSELLVGLATLFIGALVALLGVWIDRDESRPRIWAVSLSLLIVAATLVGSIETWMDHFDGEQMEEDVARMLTAMVRLANQTGDPRLQELVEAQLNRNVNDVRVRMESRMRLEGVEVEHTELSGGEDTGSSVLAMLTQLPTLLDELGFDLWVALASVIVAGLAALLGVWIERSPGAPRSTGVFLSLLILLVIGISLVQSVFEVVQSEQLESDMANILVDLDAISQTNANPQLQEFLATEMQVQARANPQLLQKVQNVARAQGADANAVLARHLPAAELSNLGLKQAAAPVAPAAPPPPLERQGFPLILTPSADSAEIALWPGKSEMFVVQQGLPEIGVGTESAVRISPLGQAYSLELAKSQPQPIASSTRQVRIRRLPLASVIHFDNNSTDVTAEQLRSVDRLIRTLSDIPGTIGIQITGHSDKIGSPPHNQWLSEERAEKLATYIRNHLPNPRFTISTAGRGATQPLPGLPPEAPENRRAVIEVMTPNTP